MAQGHAEHYKDVSISVTQYKITTVCWLSFLSTLQRSQGMTAWNLQGAWPGPATVNVSQSSSSNALVPVTTIFGRKRSMGTAASCPSSSFSFSNDACSHGCL